MKFYKVLRRINKKLVSANIHFYQRYFTNKVNLPKIPGSKLFVFEDITSAHTFRTFTMHGIPCFIYEVEVTNPIKLTGQILSPSDISDSWKTDRSTIVNSWKTYLETNDFNHSIFKKLRITLAPRNTVLCDSIKIIKLIK